jgi:hypothetical protein
MSRHEFSRSTKHSDERADIVRKPTTFLPALALGFAGAISAAAPSLADPITYELQFIGTGCLGGAAIIANCVANPPNPANPTFTQANVTLTMVNDTGNIIPPDLTSPFYEINGTATVSVSGVNGGAPATFMDTMQFYTDSSSLVGFFDAFVNVANGGLDIVDESSNAFSGYDLTAIGPTTDMAQPGGGVPPNFPGFELTSGDFFLLTGLGDGTSANATFTATVAAVPAPPIGRGLSVALAVGGVLFGASLCRRRQRLIPLN